MSGPLARHYDAKYAGEAEGAPPPATRPRRIPTNRFEACVRYLPERFRGGALLELAAGRGRVARGLIDAGLAFDRYVVSERSEARLEGLRRTLAHPRVQVMALDAEALPRDLGRFDAILMVALIEHLLDPLRALSRVREHLAPGGFVYLDTPNAAKYTRRLKLLFGRFPSTASRNEGLTTYAGTPVDLFDEGHLHYFTYRSLSQLLVRRCGFARVEKLAYSGGGRLLGRRLDHALARLRPELFSELCLVAYA